MTNAARDTLRRLDTILADNAEPIRSMIGQSQYVLGRVGAQFGQTRRDRCRPRTPHRRRENNRAPGLRSDGADAICRDIANAPRGQLTVAEPTALIVFETRKFLVRPIPSEDPTFANAEWSDNVPKLLQTKIIQSFENAGLSQAVARPAEGVVGRQATRDRYSKIPDFDVARADGRNRVCRQDTVGQRPHRGSQSVPRERTGGHVNAPSAAAALDQAFGTCATELVTWAAAII